MTRRLSHQYPHPCPWASWALEFTTDRGLEAREGPVGVEWGVSADPKLRLLHPHVTPQNLLSGPGWAPETRVWERAPPLTLHLLAK